MLKAFPSNNPSIYMKYERGKKQFVFMDATKTPLGKFNIYHLIKYLVEPIDFLPRLRDAQYKESKKAITKYICYRKEKNKISIFDYRNSPFMKNMEMISKLNNALFHFEKEEMPKKLLAIKDKKTSRKIMCIVKRFIHELLNYTVRLWALHLSENKTGLPDKFKEDILNTTIGTVYRLLKFTQKEIMNQAERNKELNRNMQVLNETRTKLGQKMDILISSIKSSSMAKLAVTSSSIQENKSEESEVISHGLTTSSSKHRSYRTESSAETLSEESEIHIL